MAKLISIQKPAGLDTINEAISGMEQRFEKSLQQLQLSKKLRTLPEYTDPFIERGELAWLDSQLSEADKAAKETQDAIADAKRRREEAVQEWFENEKAKALNLANEIERQASTLTGPTSFLRRKKSKAQAWWLRHKKGGLRQLQRQIEQLTGIAL